MPRNEKTKEKTTVFAKNTVINGVKIIDMNNLGNGVAKIDGKTVFVKSAVPGDLYDIKIIKDRTDFAVAIVANMKSPSEHRVDPICPVYKRCGGCVYRAIDYRTELELKTRTVKSAFAKEGLFPEFEDILFGKDSCYRNKVQYPVSYDRKIGYFAERTHEIVPVTSCLLQDDRFEPILREIKIFIDRNDIPGYDEESGKGVLRHICMRVAEGGISVCFVINCDNLTHSDELVRVLCEKFPNIASISVSVNKNRDNVILGKSAKLLWGKPTIADRLRGLEFEISPMSFYQVNRDMTEKLYEKATEYADLADGQTLVDLFCGVGTIGMSIIKDKPNARLVGIEIIPEAVENARHNAERNGIKNAAFVCADANAKEVGDADVIVIDPPRKGCDKQLIERIAQSSCSRVVYVSCNPATLARDCKRFVEHGFSVDRVTPADLFPRTGHVECAALMKRTRE